MHTVLYEKLKKVLHEYEEQTDALHRTQTLLSNLNLLTLLDNTDKVHCIQDYWYTDDGTEPADRWWITITLPYSYKTLIRPLLFAAIDTIGPWTKSYYVHPTYIHVDPYHLHEMWIAKWDPAGHPERADVTAHNKLTIKFVRSAKAGEKLTDTCSVETVLENNEPSTHDRLTVVCKKPTT